MAAGSGPLAGKLTPEYPKWSGCQSQQRRVPARVAICCRKADPVQGPNLGSCLTLRNELSEETHVQIKQETLLGKGTQVESSRVREPRTAFLATFNSPIDFLHCGTPTNCMVVSEFYLPNFKGT